MRKSDDGLRGEFCARLPQVHWVRIETGMTEPGVPDLNGAWQDYEFWVECKSTRGWVVSSFAAAQVGWLERRARAGGRCFVAVRQRNAVGTRDDLWLFGHSAARRLIVGERVDEVTPRYGTWKGGPSQWDWPRVLQLLTT